MTNKIIVKTWDLADDTQLILTMKGPAYDIEIMQEEVEVSLTRSEAVILSDAVQYAESEMKKVPHDS